MTTFTTEDRLAVEQEPIPFAGMVDLPPEPVMLKRTWADKVAITVIVIVAVILISVIRLGIRLGGLVS